MIGVALLPVVVAQLAAAAPLVVRDANRTVRVPTVSTAAGVMLRPDALAGMLPVTVHHDSSTLLHRRDLGRQAPSSRPGFRW